MKIASKDIQRIAIFRALQLGDTLCAIPAIRALHQTYPAAEITLLGLPWAESFINRFPNYFHSFIHFPGYPGLPEQPFNPADVTRFIDTVQQLKFDLVLQMHGNGSIINPMIELLGGRYTAGFYLPGDYCPNADLFIQYPDNVHEINRHLALMQHLGIEATDTKLEFPISQQDEDEVAGLQVPFLPGHYFCIHPGSRSPKRQWPVAYFASLANYCAKEGFGIVITGVSNELAIINELKEQLNTEPFIATDKSLGAVALLIKNAAGMISNCTGPSHIAAAVETPSVVISMDGEMERWAPLNKKRHRSVDWTKTTDYEIVLQELKLLLADIKGNHFRHNAVRTIQQFTY
jgi:ADP-heptose:LPS heptosyltransferase